MLDREYTGYPPKLECIDDLWEVKVLYKRGDRLFATDGRTDVTLIPAKQEGYFTPYQSRNNKYPPLFRAVD